MAPGSQGEGTCPQSRGKNRRERAEPGVREEPGHGSHKEEEHSTFQGLKAGPEEHWKFLLWDEMNQE